MQGGVNREGMVSPMPVRRDKSGRWRYREMVRLPDGTRERISGTAPKRCNTKVAAQQAMLDHIDRLLHPERAPKPRKEVPTFKQWFEGRFWHEWVVSRKNKPSEVESKRSIFRVHLADVFGELPLDEIDVATIARFRATLIQANKSDKTINNILAVLSKALKYAEQAQVIARAPAVGLLKVERPEIVAWSLEEYARLLEAARRLDPVWYTAVCLAGEAGLRIGEVRALDWRRDVDLVAGTLTINKQTRRGETTTPKGRTRRTVPMTDTLLAALRGLDQIRTGFVVRNLDGTAMSDNQTKYHCYRICRAAGLPEQGWHTLRHSYGTHAAMFGANPWKLMQWMGHKRIDETMLYVHFAEAHLRPLPEALLAARQGHDDPDRRVVALLGARRLCGKEMAKPLGLDEESPGVLLA
jgi:integrase